MQSTAATLLHGIGCDVVRVARFTTPSMLALRHRFCKRALSAAEMRALSSIGDGAAAAQFIASRWALKEAAIKAAGTARLLFPEVTLAHESDWEDGGARTQREVDMIVAARLPLRVAIVGRSAELLRSIGVATVRGHPLPLEIRAHLAECVADMDLSQIGHASVSHEVDGFAMAVVALERESVHVAC